MMVTACSDRSTETDIDTSSEALSRDDTPADGTSPAEIAIRESAEDATAEISAGDSPMTDTDTIAEEITVDLPNLPEGATPLVLIRIPAGSFIMGSSEEEPYHEPNESPQHRVTITRDFYLGKYEITQAQWKCLMEENPSTDTGDNLPVNRVSWEEAQEFIKRLNALHQTDKFRMPTEAEWEYAARAGTQSPNYISEEFDEEALLDHAWFRNNSEGELHPVGQLQPNPWGLYDIFGNVWEWTQDWYAPEYPDQEQIDPTGPEQGEEKVYRGASWMARVDYMRAADRGKFTPDQKRNTGGFALRSL